MKSPDEIKAELMREIEDARACFDNPPPNESCTCDWVIRPLLEKAGYEKREIVSRASDAAGKYPDYTILPNGSYTWYLEAKPWQGGLQDDRDLDQALSYAHRNGSRWVVLTNGREWRLYDDYVREPDARLVAEFNLKDSDFLDFMLALSKPSVQAGELEQFANAARLNATLCKGLTNGDGPLCRNISRVLRNEYGIDSAQPSEVARYFRENLIRGASFIGPASEAGLRSPVSSVPDVQLATEALRTGNKRNARLPGASQSRKSLEDLFQRSENEDREKKVWKLRAKPVAVAFSDDSHASVSGWKYLSIEVITWLSRRHELPVPFRCGGGRRGGRWFLNDRQEHQKGKSMPGGWARMQLGGRTVFVYTQIDADHHVQSLHRLCREVGENPSTIVVELDEKL